MLRVVYKPFMGLEPMNYLEAWDLPVDRLTSFWWREICTHAADLANEHADTIDFDIVRVSSSADPIAYMVDGRTCIYGVGVGFGLATPMLVALDKKCVNVTCWRHKGIINEIVMERRHYYAD